VYEIVAVVSIVSTVTPVGVTPVTGPDMAVM
jgi:hypothetical protein